MTRLNKMACTPMPRQELTMRQSKFLEWLSIPFFETSSINNNNMLTGAIHQVETRNVFFTKMKVGIPNRLNTVYRLSKLSTLILGCITIFIIIKIYKRKHK